jgi:hypothetical protein
LPISTKEPLCVERQVSAASGEHTEWGSDARPSSRRNATNETVPMIAGTLSWNARYARTAAAAWDSGLP